VLDAGLVAHLGVITGGWPMVVHTCYGYDPDTLYLHGSVASQSLDTAGLVRVTITLTDGLVLARSAFEHTINYCSAMIYGQPRLVADPAERLAGLRCITEHASLAAGMAGAATDSEQSLRVTAIGAKCRVRGTGYSFHGPGPRSTERKKITHLTCRFTEPVSGIEPLTCRLQAVQG
jgi:nitroimidazol reductase NimA-like FMN-containing flavoprotein (pyridoxamine 5'-phosphate oxidase superfamily)